MKFETIASDVPYECVWHCFRVFLSPEILSRVMSLYVSSRHVSLCFYKLTINKYLFVMSSKGTINIYLLVLYVYKYTINTHIYSFQIFFQFNFKMEQYIPYSLTCNLFSRNLETYLHTYIYIFCYVCL